MQDKTNTAQELNVGRFLQSANWYAGNVKYIAKSIK